MKEERERERREREEGERDGKAKKVVEKRLPNKGMHRSRRSELHDDGQSCSAAR
jgi:hypothetical protein